MENGVAGQQQPLQHAYLDVMRQKFSCARINKAQALHIHTSNNQEPQTSFFAPFLSSLILAVQFASTLNL